MPTAAEKEEAKTWVEEHSCKAWCGGWCMVDGTQIPLADRPYWFGESYFDRKCNYSLNVQAHLYPCVEKAAQTPNVLTRLDCLNV